MSKSKTVDTIQAALTQPGTAHTVLLTTFRRSGQGVGSPVGMAVADGKLYFMTPATTWKAKRIANNPQVTLALCTFEGKVLSPEVAGVARRLSGKEARRARALLRVGFKGWIMNTMSSCSRLDVNANFKPIIYSGGGDETVSMALPCCTSP